MLASLNLFCQRSFELFCKNILSSMPPSVERVQLDIYLHRFIYINAAFSLSDIDASLLAAPLQRAAHPIAVKVRVQHRMLPDQGDFLAALPEEYRGTVSFEGCDEL